MRIFLLLFISFIWFSNAVGQTGPKSFTSQSILFTSATIHTGDGHAGGGGDRLVGAFSALQREKVENGGP